MELTFSTAKFNEQNIDNGIYFPEIFYVRVNNGVLLKIYIIIIIIR